MDSDTSWAVGKCVPYLWSAPDANLALPAGASGANFNCNWLAALDLDGYFLTEKLGFAGRPTRARAADTPRQQERRKLASRFHSSQLVVPPNRVRGRCC